MALKPAAHGWASSTTARRLRRGRIAARSHPDMTCSPGIDYSTGSLGQGLSVASAWRRPPGAARARRVVLGDGEARRFRCGKRPCSPRAAGRQPGPRRDANGFQECGAIRWRIWRSSGPPRLARAGDRRADHAALSAPFERAIAYRGARRSSVAHTTKARGIAAVEADPVRFHCTRMRRTSTAPAADLG